MKRLLFLLMMFLFLDSTIAQSCLPNGIFFFTQAQIDDFQINYPNCTEIQGDVIIQGNDITNLDGIDVLTLIGGDLSILFNPILNDMAGLANVVSIGGGLYITHNFSLNSLSGLEGLTSIGSFFDLRSNDALTNIFALHNLEHIGDYFDVSFNGSLISLEGLDGLTFIGNGLIISNNNNLTSVAGMDKLSCIEGGLGIDFNNSLVNLSGLEGLSNIQGGLRISYNHSLTSIVTLESLNSICGGLYIYGNDSLTNLTGLDNINADSISDLSIYSNLSLNNCAVQSICTYLVSPNGTINIHDNATGCNSQQEVVTECGVGLDHKTFSKNYLNIYPNPSSKEIIIETTNKGILSIFSPNNKEIVTCQINKNRTVIDISDLSSNVYFIRFQNENSVQTRKLIKQ